MFRWHSVARDLRQLFILHIILGDTIIILYIFDLVDDLLKIFIPLVETLLCSLNFILLEFFLLFIFVLEVMCYLNEKLFHNFYFL